MRWTIFVFACIGLALACDGSSPSVQWSHYARNCGADSDCVPMADESDCVCPVCPNRAINVSDIQQYQKDLVAYQNACADSGIACSNMTCPVVTPFCDNGTCQVK